MSAWLSPHPEFIHVTHHFFRASKFSISLLNSIHSDALIILNYCSATARPAGANKICWLIYINLLFNVENQGSSYVNSQQQSRMIGSATVKQPP